MYLDSVQRRNLFGRQTRKPTETPDGEVYTSRLLDDVNINYSLTDGNLQVTDIDAINNMIENILTTTPGERPFEPEFGSDIPGMLFDPCDETTAWKMETAAFTALKRWMPYVSVDRQNSRFMPDPNQAAFNVVIVFVLRFSGLRGEFRNRLVQG